MTADSGQPRPAIRTALSTGILVLLGLMTVACSGDGTASPTNGPSDGATWYEDVAPLMNTYCLDCHLTGGVAPVALDTFAVASQWGPAIRRAVADRTMPPYYTVNDGSCGDFTSPWLSDDEISVFESWAEGGYLEGDSAAGPDPYVPQSGLSGNVTTLGLDAPYSPVISGSPDAPKDDYRCFLLSTGPGADAFVTAFEVEPGNQSIVHHMIMYTLDPTTEAGQDADGQAITNSAAIETLQADNADRAGWPCYGTTGQGTIPNGLLGSWAPGSAAITMPEGTGVSWRGNDWLVAQIHYNLDNGAGTDQSQVHLALTDTVQTEGFFITPDGLLQTLYEGDPFIINPQEASTTFTWEARIQDLSDFLAEFYSDRFDTPPTAYNVYAVLPHMHDIGKSIGAVRFDDAAGEQECLSQTPQWDFNWQHMYFFDEPVYFGAEHRVVVTCEYDSRSRVTPTFPGENSIDEMCLYGIYFTVTPER